MRPLPGQGRVDGGRFPLGPTPNNGEIFLCDPLLLHEQAKASRRRRIFRDENDAAGFAIESIDDGDLATIRDLVGEELFQFSPKGAGVAGFGRMNEQKWRLIDDDKIVAFRDDLEIGGVCARRLAGG